jgi:two-component system LytT family response regulator
MARPTRSAIGNLRSMPHESGNWSSEGSRRKLLLRVKERLILVDEAEVERVDAAGKHVLVTVGDATYQVRAKLQALERTLHAARFLRIHRSTIVNLAAVAGCIRGPHGDLLAVLKSGKRLAIGRRYQSAFVVALQEATRIPLER